MTTQTQTQTPARSALICAVTEHGRCAGLVEARDLVAGIVTALYLDANERDLAATVHDLVWRRLDDRARELLAAGGAR